MEVGADDISEDGELEEVEEDPVNPIISSKGMHPTKVTISGIHRSSKVQEIQVRSKPAFERQNSPTRGSLKLQSASATKQHSEPYNLKSGKHTENRTATCRNPNDKDDPVGEEYNNDDDERSDQG